MTSPFEEIIQRLIDLGFYDFFLPFILSSAIFYALLKKSKIISESSLVNATLALSIAFLIFGYPVIAGISLASPFSNFFVQITIWILIFAFGFLLASLFYPDITKFLTSYFVERRSRFIWVAIVLGIIAFITSGLVSVLTGPLGQTPKPGQTPSPPLDVIALAAGIFILIAIIVIAASVISGR